MRELEYNRPNSGLNLQWLLAYCDHESLRDGKHHGPLQQRELAAALNRDPSAVTRMLKSSQMSQQVREGVMRFFKLDQYPGLPPDLIDLPPQEFQRKLTALGYGKMASQKDGQDWLCATAQTTGHFVPQEILSLMLRDEGPYRSFGIERDDDLEIPNATCRIGERYGIALEIDEPAVVRAVRDRQASFVLVHRDRATQLMTAMISNRNTILGELPWLFVKPPRRPEGLDMPSIALLAERLVEGTKVNYGYQVLGDPGRRDIFIFLFAADAGLGPEWRTKGAVLDASEMTLLKDFAADAQSRGNVAIRRIVYDAIAA